MREDEVFDICGGGHDKIVECLLAHNPALIDAVASDNMTALHLAAWEGHINVVAELLARRPSFLAEDWDGRTPLFCAAIEGHQEVVDLFPLTTDQVLCPHISLFQLFFLCTLPPSLSVCVSSCFKSFFLCFRCITATAEATLCCTWLSIVRGTSSLL